MNENKEIINKAKELGLDTSGSSENEQLTQIAKQIGISNYNWMNDRYDLVNKINELYNSNNNFNNTKSNIQKQQFQQRNISRSNNQMSSFLPNNSDKKYDETVSNKLKRRHNNQYRNYAQNEDLTNQQHDNEQQADKKLNGRKNKISNKVFNAIGIPSFFTKPLTSKKSDNEVIPSVVTGTISITTATVAFGLIFVVVVVVIIVICIAGFTSQDDISGLNSNANVTGYIKGDVEFSDLSDTLVYMNLCMTNNNSMVEEQQCLDSNPGKFFTHLKELYEQYQKYTDINGEPILLDFNLILETISYSRTDSELFDDSTINEIINELDELAEAMVEEYQEKGDLYYEDKYIVRENNKWITKTRCLNKEDEIVRSSSNQKTYYRISDDKYISYLKYGKVHENYNGSVKIYDVNIHPDSDSTCIPAGRTYKSSSVVRYVGH